MSGSSVRAVVTALAGFYTTAAPAGYDVVARRPVDPLRKILTVGWSGSPDQPPIQVPQRIPVSAAGGQYQESVEITCLLNVWDGTAAPDVVDDELFDTFDLLDAALAADQQLDGVAVSARVASFDYVPVTVAEGHAGQMRFTVAALTWK